MDGERLHASAIPAGEPRANPGITLNVHRDAGRAGVGVHVWVSGLASLTGESCTAHRVPIEGSLVCSAWPRSRGERTRCDLIAPLAEPGSRQADGRTRAAAPECGMYATPADRNAGQAGFPEVE